MKGIKKLWIDAMRATADRYDNWLKASKKKRNEILDSEGLFGNTMHCSMCIAAREVKEINGGTRDECYSCVLNLIFEDGSYGTVGCLKSGSYPGRSLNILAKAVRIRRDYYLAMIERAQKIPASQFMKKMRKVILELEEEFK